MKLKVAASFSHLASSASPYNSCHAHERNIKRLNTSLLIVGFRLYYPKVSEIPYSATAELPVPLYEASLLSSGTLSKRSAVCFYDFQCRYTLVLYEFNQFSMDAAG